MLRVGLTGGLSSGKSTVADALRTLGAEVIEADELGRALMEPGQPVYAEIVRVFGPEVVCPDGRLDRARLAEMAFKRERVNELNAIVHPAVIAAQQRWMNQVFARNPAAVAVVESALIFEVERDARLRGESETVLADWRRRLDRIIVVTAPDDMKIARYVARVCPSGAGRAAGVPSDRSSSLGWEAGVPSDRSSSLGWEAAEADARQRLARQIPDAYKAARADYVIDNSGNKEALLAKVEEVWQRLRAESNKLAANESLE
ncbi:MAG: dephospho-CoA kinase [Terracidiphilus sp.]|jgi:dephospho-CoA kinase